jgi:hypothetical protein
VLELVGGSCSLIDGRTPRAVRRRSSRR